MFHLCTNCFWRIDAKQNKPYFFNHLNLSFMKSLFIALSMFALANTASAKQPVVMTKQIEISKIKSAADICYAYADAANGKRYVASGATCAQAVANLKRLMQK
jgi:hypothetical protein